MYYYLFVDYPSLKYFVVEARTFYDAYQIAERNAWQVNDDYLDCSCDYIDIGFEEVIEFSDLLDMDDNIPIF